MPEPADTAVPISEAIFSRLRSQITSGRLGPGQALPSERALAGSFGVNRHAVREALKRLQQAGLVEVSQGGATRVLDLHSSAGLDLLPHLSLRVSGRVDPKVLRSALEMRIAIGADAARLCAQRAVSSVPGRLFGVVEEMERTDDVDALADLDTRFWGTVIDGADNVAYRLAFNSLIRCFRANQKPARALIAGEVLDRDGRRAVAAAIEERDERGAESAARETLSGSLEVALELLLEVPMSSADPLIAPASAIPTRKGGGAVTLVDCARAFLRFPSPWIIAAGIAVALVARIAVGAWSPLDLLAVGLLVAFQPFSEWLIHVGLLHSKPLELGPLTVDLPTARLHRWHHRHPTELRTVLIPPGGIAAILPLVAATMWVLTLPLGLVGDHTALFLSATLCGYALLAIYEWCHFIIHTPYRPRSRYYKTIWRSHRLHHFKNEHFWFGVSSDAADRVLGTSPDHRTVSKSRTARNLGSPGTG